MSFWKVYCEEHKYPGMWQHWFRHQCVGIGWAPQKGYRMEGATKGSRGWSGAREALRSIEIGDYVIVALQGNRVGRLGRVTGKKISDAEWDPLVPRSRSLPYGEMGRRVLVRWDLTTGPESRDMVVALPQHVRFASGELRRTIAEVHSRSVKDLKIAMSKEANWVGLLTHFHLEKALSGYIAAYPHRLEDGLLPHPYKRVREKVFDDKRRLDVLLTDRKGRPVIVECKQGDPTTAHLKQLRHYMGRLLAETEQEPRGILVHGGARKLRPEVKRAASKQPRIEIVQYAVHVDFLSCF